MTSYKALLFLFAFLFISTTLAHNSHTCGHDKHQGEPQFVDIEEDFSSLTEGRFLQSTEYPQIKIAAHYDFLNAAPSSYKSYIQDELAPAVISWFEGALKVKYPVQGLLKIPPTITTVCDLKTPAILNTVGVPADYFIIFDSQADETSTVAVSKYCYLAAGTKRPLIAASILNRNMVVESQGNVLLHEKNTYLLIHELMHTLGISANTFPLFLDETGATRTGHVKTRKLNGVTRMLIDVPPLTERLRNFYGCPSIEGLYMENNGGMGTANSHFEKKFFVYETMSAGSIIGKRISEFSLALLEGSGWYVPDYNYAEPYLFGQGKGCDFINAKCSLTNATFAEYCAGNDRGCAPNGRGGGKCRVDPLSEGCKYFYPDEDYDCENLDGLDNARLPDLQVYGRGAGSKCFNGDLNIRKSNNGRTSFCFKYTCTGEGANTQLEVNVGNDKVICQKAEKKAIDGYYGAIECPDPITFCNTIGKKYCPRNCMGRGTCVNDTCQCREGFVGIDCGLLA